MADYLQRGWQRPACISVDRPEAPDSGASGESGWLDIVVRQQTDDGSIDELRNIKVENIDPELFAIPEGYKSVESQLTDLNKDPVKTFGTAIK